MTHLRIFDEAEPARPLSTHVDYDDIRSRLAEAGIRLERWQASAPLAPGAPAAEVIAAYREDIDRLMRDGGYQAVDVVSMHPAHPDKEALRRKFLDEHTHAEDEVRFFVAGQGLFSLHIGTRVYEVLCTRGDLIAVPAGTRHWFDMGPEPEFVAIRLFTNPAGWVAQFTGTDIAARFPRLDHPRLAA